MGNAALEVMGDSGDVLARQKGQLARAIGTIVGTAIHDSLDDPDSHHAHNIAKMDMHEGLPYVVKNLVFNNKGQIAHHVNDTGHPMFYHERPTHDTPQGRPLFDRHGNRTQHFAANSGRNVFNSHGNVAHYVQHNPHAHNLFK